MPLTPSQKQALADELIDVMECFQHYEDHYPNHYEALITQPSADHLIIKLQPACPSGE